MAKGSEYEGKTLEEAIEKGLKALGLRREEAQIVKIEEGKDGLLGMFFKRPFRVSVARRPGGALREPEETTERRVTSGRDDRRGGRGGRDRGRETRGRDAQGGKERGRGERGAKPQPQEAAAGRSDAPRAERRSERRDERPRDERPREDRPREDRPRDERPRDERPREDRPREDRPREDRPRDDRPREDRPREERGRRSREDRGRDERGPRPQAPPVEAARPPGAPDDGPEELMPVAGVPFAADGDETAEGLRRRRRRGRRGGRGRRRGGALDGGPDDAPDTQDEALDAREAVTPRPVRAAEAAPVAAPVRAAEAAPVVVAVRAAEPVATAPEPIRREYEPAPVREVAPAALSPVAPAIVVPQAQPAAERYDEENEPTMGTTELGETAKKLTEDLLRGMGFEATVTVTAEGNRADVTVEVAQGDDLLTGEKGEVRGAMQHLLNRFLNRGEGSRYHLQLEINDFWQRREAELETMARSMADDAVARNVEVMSEFMNAQERRIVHVTLREDSRVKTYSPGEGMIKRVVVAPADLPGRMGEEAAG